MLYAEYELMLLYCRFYLPSNVTLTKGGIRGRKAWFTEREVQIAVTRLVRDDPSKRDYEYVKLPACL
jgi:hypothetical protein